MRFYTMVKVRDQLKLKANDAGRLDTGQQMSKIKIKIMLIATKHMQ
jgi:hypothetical protein